MAVQQALSAGMSAAIIAADGRTILGCIVADPALDIVPADYPGAILVAAPSGCNADWTYDPVGGFTPPNGSTEGKKVEF